jgi:hypothetical protein
VKRKPSPQDEAIIELLRRLGNLGAEYPAELSAARRAAFVAQIGQHKTVGGDEGVSSEKQIFELLEQVKPVVADYPPDLLAARRAAFVAQIQQHHELGVPQETPSEAQVMEILEQLRPAIVDYPPDLLAARRAAFIAQIQQHNQVEVHGESLSKDQVIGILEHLKPAMIDYPAELLAARRAAFLAQIDRHLTAGVERETASATHGRVVTLLERLKSIELEYPLKLWSARRSAFVAQIRDSKTSVLEAVRAAIRTVWNGRGAAPAETAISFRRMSLVLAALLVAAFAASLLYGGPQLLSRGEASNVQLISATSTDAVAEVICKPGYLPPLCLAQEFDKSSDLTFPGNGKARPAVAKDTLPGYSRIHDPAYVNDGQYGPGASWISNSAYSWIKIDLGEPRSINTVTFGRDRLGNLNDGDPGQFVIAVALSDDVYADGDSSNDFMEYTPVYSSAEAGFDGIVSGPETIQATFSPVTARFIKITFENPGTAVDEIEVFMLQPPGLVVNPTQKPREHVSASFTPVPTNTLIPSQTPTLVPSRTPRPTFTFTPRPTLTSSLTLTPTDVPTETATPIPTDTAIPPTATLPPSNTPPPTATQPPTSTPVPTNTPVPTSTSVPPLTDTPEPPMIYTQPPPSFTAEPEADEPFVGGFVNP